MKKISILLVLGLLVLLVGAAQPAYANRLNVLKAEFGDILPEMAQQIARLNAAASKFEGLLNAYSASRPDEFMPWADDYWPLPKNLFSSARNLSGFLEEFNATLLEVYPTLSEEEQLAVEEAYSSMGLYFEDLAVRTNTVFGKEVLRIEFREGHPDFIWVPYQNDR